MKARPSKLVAIAYLRVSTDDQLLGPEAQRASIVAWAERHGISVAAWHCDAGVSGAAPLADRPALLDAVAGLREHGAAVLVVAKRDRLARDVMVAAMIEREAEKAGATVVSADGAGDGAGPEAQLMRRIIDAFAEYERALIRARVRAALAVKKARGERVGSVPYGFRAGENGKLEADRDESVVVAVAVKNVSQGASLRDTVTYLNARYESRSGNPFTLTQVARMVKRWRDANQAA